MKILSNWDNDNKISTYTIIYKGNKFTGIAKCHEVDFDMGNEKTGIQIAESRALIKMLQYIKNTELTPSIAALTQLYASMKYSKQFNENSYEAKAIKRKISRLKAELEENKKLIARERLTLYDFINNKDEFYKKIRKNREAK